jgi:hypothetical protein
LAFCAVRDTPLTAVFPLLKAAGFAAIGNGAKLAPLAGAGAPAAVASGLRTLVSVDA